MHFSWRSTRKTKNFISPPDNLVHHSARNHMSLFSISLMGIPVVRVVVFLETVFFSVRYDSSTMLTRSSSTTSPKVFQCKSSIDFQPQKLELSHLLLCSVKKWRWMGSSSHIFLETLSMCHSHISLAMLKVMVCIQDLLKLQQNTLVFFCWISSLLCLHLSTEQDNLCNESSQLLQLPFQHVKADRQKQLLSLHIYFLLPHPRWRCLRCKKPELLLFSQLIFLAALEFHLNLIIFLLLWPTLLNLFRLTLGHHRLVNCVHSCFYSRPENKTNVHILNNFWKQVLFVCFNGCDIDLHDKTFHVPWANWNFQSLHFNQQPLNCFHRFCRWWSRV